MSDEYKKLRKKATLIVNEIYSSYFTATKLGINTQQFLLALTNRFCQELLKQKEQKEAHLKTIENLNNLNVQQDRINCLKLNNKDLQKKQVKLEQEIEYLNSRIKTLNIDNITLRRKTGELKPMPKACLDSYVKTRNNSLQRDVQILREKLFNLYKRNQNLEILLKAKVLRYKTEGKLKKGSQLVTKLKELSYGNTKHTTNSQPSI